MSTKFPICFICLLVCLFDVLASGFTRNFSFSISTLCLCSCHCSYYYHSCNDTNVNFFFNYYSIYLGYWSILMRNKGKQNVFEQWSYTSSYKLVTLYHSNILWYVYFSRHMTVKRVCLQALLHSSELTLPSAKDIPLWILYVVE